MGARKLSALRKVYSVAQDAAPLEVEEVADAQLSALVRVGAGGDPCTDFGAWGPFGNRIAKQLRFTSQFMAGSGGLRTKELRGPENTGAWESALGACSGLRSWPRSRRRRCSEHRGRRDLGRAWAPMRRSSRGTGGQVCHWS